VSGPPAAIVVNHDAGDALLHCIASLRAGGVQEIVVVDNASSDGSAERLEAADPTVRVLRTGDNLGYGAGANRGLALVEAELVLVSNPDVVVHPGALEALAQALDTDPTLALVGPYLLAADGTRYPSARRFPSWLDAAGHALLGAVSHNNRFTRRYRMADLPLEVPSRVDWVSGACFLARRRALEELGGFDERYFMYLEDVDLCWRAHRAGYDVAFVPAAVVTHLQGHSTARHPYRMLAEHHRSALLFALRRSDGWRRLALPGVTVLLVVRFLVSAALQALRSSLGGAHRAD
jgi:N-acetylglucosaminyl-diphospho-decaprenol L-rhamnosyltransferase